MEGEQFEFEVGSEKEGFRGAHSAVIEELHWGSSFLNHWQTPHAPLAGTVHPASLQIKRDVSVRPTDLRCQPVFCLL
jgi:hypothetical protein